MVKGLSRLESLLASALSTLVSLFDDLPRAPYCGLFFGEPEYPSDEE